MTISISNILLGFVLINYETPIFLCLDCIFWTTQKQHRYLFSVAVLLSFSLSLFQKVCLQEIYCRMERERTFCAMGTS